MISAEKAGARKQCLECGTMYRRGQTQIKPWLRSQFCSPECKNARANGLVWNRARSNTNAGGCWLWPFGKDADGYGQTVHLGRNVRAHRVSWLRHRGDTGGLQVLHKCDVPSCVNPDHLFLGTQADNMRDRDAKGRTAMGERGGGSKLTVSGVLEIRREIASGADQRGLARRHGIHYTTIRRIATGRTWRDAQAALEAVGV